MKIDPSRLMRLRTARVLSLRELARLSGVSHDAISAIERGRRQPHPATIRKLALGLGVAPEALLLRPDDDGPFTGQQGKAEHFP